MRAKGRIFTTALFLVLMFQFLAGQVLASNEDYKILFYDEQTGDGAVGYLNGSSYQALSYFGPGYFSRYWTHIADGGFFYRQPSGEGAKVQMGLGPDGSVSTLWQKSGFFPWSTITYHEGYLLFYQKANGSAVIGRAGDNNFENLVIYPPGAFGRWSHIISTQKGLFFYDEDTGAGAMGKFVYKKNAFGTPYITGFTTLTVFPANYFSPGYTSFAYTQNGFLLYNKYTGFCHLAKIGDNGNVVHVPYSGWPQVIPAGYSHIVSTGDRLFFYNKDTGAASVGYLGPDGPYVPIQNYLQPLTWYPAGAFKTGWSHVTLQYTSPL